MSRKELPPSAHAQRVFDNLVKAARNGAIAAGFENGEYNIYPGPIIDKDSFEYVTDAYNQCLVKSGVSLRNADETAKKILQKLYEETPIQQNNILTDLRNAIAVLGNNTNGTHIR